MHVQYWFLYHVFAKKNPYKCDIWSFCLCGECETATTNAWTSNLATSKIFLGCHIFCLLSRYNFSIFFLIYNVRLQAKNSILRPFLTAFRFFLRPFMIFAPFFDCTSLFLRPFMIFCVLFWLYLAFFCALLGYAFFIVNFLRPF